MNSIAGAHTAAPSAMVKSLIRLMVITAFGSFGIIQALFLVLQPAKAWSGSFAAAGILMVCVAAIAATAFYYALKKLVPFIDASAQEQARFLDALNTKYVDAAILCSAALSLFMELGCIRWQSSVSFLRSV